ncbi:MAG TPA: TonB-dependent receptor [Steroidobacteraceae bacterium]|nr:TonB-dependent receptor [Steroidobacteraceae bacterium]
MRNSGFDGTARGVIACTALVGMMLATHSRAQQQAPAAAGGQGEELEQIVVTAERRSERLQDVPISITNLSADDLKRAETTELGGIMQLTPGLRIDYAGTFVFPTIRGVGSNVPVSGGGANVGIYIDGFFSPNTETNDFKLLNVESIQVLKGPQGTLFGRNTTGGAILVNTTKPSADTNAIVQLDWGSFNTQIWQGYFTTGSPTLAFDLAGLYTTSDGWIHNIANGDSDAGAYRDESARMGFLFTPLDNLSFLLRYTHTDTRDPTNLTENAFVIGGVPQVYGRFAPVFFPGTNVVIATDPDQVAYGQEPVYMLQHTNVVQLTSAWDFGPGSLTSYTQYRLENGETYESLDYDSFRALNILIGVRDHTFTQELLATSKPGTPLQWTAGVYYSDTYDAWPTDGVVLYALHPQPLSFLAGSSTTVRSTAGYFDLTYQALDNLFLTGGYRYTHDEELNPYYTSAAGLYYPTCPALGTNNLCYPNLTSNRGTPRAVIRYALDPSSSVYVSFSEGFKSAIYNVGGGQLNAVQPESLKAYEIGYKYAGSRLTGDAAAFWYDYKDLQVETYNVVNGVPVSIINNAASAHPWGFDGDLKFQVVEGLVANVGANYTHANYGVYTASPYFSECLNPKACGPAFGLYNNLTLNASGYEMLRAPRFTADAGAVYTIPVAVGKLAFSGEYYHTSKFYFDSSQQFPQGQYSTLDVRAEWTNPSGLVSVALFGNNVTDTRYLTQVLGNTFGIGAAWSAPATYGISIKVKAH